MYAVLYFVSIAFTLSFSIFVYSNLLYRLEKSDQPKGVMTVASLTIIYGILLCFSGFSFMSLGELFAAVPIGSIILGQLLQQQLQPEILNEIDPGGSQFVESAGIIIGAIVLATGVGYLLVFYGLVEGHERQWTIALILTLITLVMQVISITSASIFNAYFPSKMNALTPGIIALVVGLGINGVILYYLLYYLRDGAKLPKYRIYLRGIREPTQ